MTLNITSSEIQIKNSSGQVKFTSNDKLLYLITETTGTVPVTGQTIIVNRPTGYSNVPENKRISFISVKINSCSGANFPSNLLGVLTPANRSIIVHFQAGAVNKNLGRVSPYGEMGILTIAPNRALITEYGIQYYAMALTASTFIFRDRNAHPELYNFGINLTYYYRLYSFL